jgi:hypothetical protein
LGAEQGAGLAGGWPTVIPPGQPPHPPPRRAVPHFFKTNLRPRTSASPQNVRSYSSRLLSVRRCRACSRDLARGAPRRGAPPDSSAPLRRQLTPDPVFPSPPLPDVQLARDDGHRRWRARLCVRRSGGGARCARFQCSDSPACSSPRPSRLPSCPLALPISLHCSAKYDAVGPMCVRKAERGMPCAFALVGVIRGRAAAAAALFADLSRGTALHRTFGWSYCMWVLSAHIKNHKPAQ